MKFRCGTDLAPKCTGFVSRWPAGSAVAEIGECGMLSGMTAKILRDVLERVETWPEEAQMELAEIALEIDAGLAGGVYHATPDELEGIDRGLKAAREGRFATDEEVEA